MVEVASWIAQSEPTGTHWWPLGQICLLRRDIHFHKIAITRGPLGIQIMFSRGNYACLLDGFDIVAVTVHIRYVTTINTYTSFD